LVRENKERLFPDASGHAAGFELTDDDITEIEPTS
jgi:hypothetical protein